jgi:hypothetical protein
MQSRVAHSAVRTLTKAGSIDEDARMTHARATGAVRGATCPFCNGAAHGPCQIWPSADHLARWLATEAAGRISRDDLADTISALDILAAQVLVTERPFDQAGA